MPKQDKWEEKFRPENPNEYTGIRKTIYEMKDEKLYQIVHDGIFILAGAMKRGKDWKKLYGVISKIEE